MTADFQLWCSGKPRIQLQQRRSRSHAKKRAGQEVSCPAPQFTPQQLPPIVSWILQTMPAGNNPVPDRRAALQSGRGSMHRSFWSRLPVVLALLFVPTHAGVISQSESKSASGTVPQSASGRPLNLGFEAGNLTDWTAQGDAFKGQPIEGDLVSRRRADMQSKHQGRFWVGTFEKSGDGPQGTLTSVPFQVSKPFASFLVAGGSHASTCVELSAATPAR